LAVMTGDQSHGIHTREARTSSAGLRLEVREPSFVVVRLFEL
jgi:hypothetical protein